MGEPQLDYSLTRARDQLPNRYLPPPPPRECYRYPWLVRFMAMHTSTALQKYSNVSWLWINLRYPIPCICFKACIRCVCIYIYMYICVYLCILYVYKYLYPQINAWNYTSKASQSSAWSNPFKLYQPLLEGIAQCLPCKESMFSLIVHDPTYEITVVPMFFQCNGASNKVQFPIGQWPFCSGTSTAEDPRTSFIPIFTMSASRFRGTNLDLAKHVTGQL